MAAEPTDRQLQGFFQSGLSAIVVCLLLWVGSSVNSLQQHQAVSKVALIFIKDELETLRKLTQNMYTRSEARELWTNISLELRDVNARINDIEKERLADITGRRHDR